MDRDLRIESSQEEPLKPSMTIKHSVSLLAVGLALVACAKTDQSNGTSGLPQDAESAAQFITAPDLLRHIKDLSDDSLEGRGPGTPGEDKAVAYMEKQFRQIGLKPGNPDGSYIQSVDLIGYTSKPTAS